MITAHRDSENTEHRHASRAALRGHDVELACSVRHATARQVERVDRINGYAVCTIMSQLRGTPQSMTAATEAAALRRFNRRREMFASDVREAVDVPGRAMR